ncbi:hypothetical protein SASPL_121868 [Salvia splendens]|uniref:SAM domain-containing protein n=1 Tax=Salvia splendens TaxID=180675 RepID=A0A8X8XSQ0_SALSN|nr:hypothetical protein SASPL_121868 [Salvia splendens]
MRDVGLWLEEINLGNYREIFKENGVNGEYLEGMSMFTTEQILRFIRKCHMKWGDFITLCKELRRIKGPYPLPPSYLHVGLFERRAKGTAAMVGPGLSVGGICEGCEAEQAVSGGVVEAGILM